MKDDETVHGVDVKNEIDDAEIGVGKFNERIICVCVERTLLIQNKLYQSSYSIIK